MAARADDNTARHIFLDKKLKLLIDDHFMRLAIVDPAGTYGGRLAQYILNRAGVWDKTIDKMIVARDRSQLIHYLETGEATAVVALESSLNAYDNFEILMRLDNDLVESLTVCGAVFDGAKRINTARAFLDLFDSRLCRIYNIKGVYQN